MSPTSTERLFEVVADHGPTATDLVARALAVASCAHHGQFRRSGDPYITHPVAVAATVADLGADLTTIVAALLHDVPEDTTYPLDLLRAEFGDPVGELLDAFLLLDSGYYGEDLTGVDPRVMLLKIADRLHNMQTIGFLEKAKQQNKAGQTRKLVVPVARALGFTAVAAELDALAVSTLGDPASRRAAVEPLDQASGAGMRAAWGLLRALTRVLLPGRCQERWLAEWSAELDALSNRQDRFTFVASLLPGLPAMAVHARRHRHPAGDDR
jgi:(p)ppGpp synthase/HD superfamily hydrolase